jgi:hypothetical protein
MVGLGCVEWLEDTQSISRNRTYINKGPELEDKFDHQNMD